MTSVADVFADLDALFRRSRISWYVFGAQAVIVHGRPRMTADVDVTVDASTYALADLVADLQDGGFDMRERNVDEQARRTPVVPVIHRRTRIPVDIVLAGPGLEQEFLQRAIVFPVGGVNVPFIAPEDLIVLKLLAARPKYAEDVRSIFSRQGASMDDARIRDLLRRFEQALDRSDLIPAFEALLRF